MFALLALSLVACAPNDAEVTGNWFAWLASSTSPNVTKQTVDFDQATRIDCVRSEGEEGYIGNTDPDFDCSRVQDLRLHDFLAEDGFYAFTGAIDPWRTEAIVNSEGDFQLTVHHRLPSGEDFRFLFTIDPDFAPVECTSDAQGNNVVDYVDGSSWLDEWSADEDRAIYYLNAGAYQVNPSDAQDLWILKQEWSSGYGRAKFSEELFNSHGVDYGEYETDFVSGETTGDAFLAVDHGDELVEDPSLIDAQYDAAIENLEERVFGAGGYVDELVQVAGASVDGEPAFEHKIETNRWRPVDATAIGLDGWMEVHSSWVLIDEGSTMEPGGEASGEFQILFDGQLSASALLVRGTFTTNRIRKDRWGYEVLSDEQREESGTPFCGGAPYPWE